MIELNAIEDTCVDYGKHIKINNENMCVQILGNGEKTIVLLHGAGVSAPIMEFGPLAKLLAAAYTVVIIEYFGYGLSDKTEKERTIENISLELHTVLNGLGYTRYILMAHSISGVYGLYYTNQYQQEVEAFVGIDSSVPRQNEYLNIQAINLAAGHISRFLNRMGILKLISKYPAAFIPKISNTYWNEAESRLLKKLYLKNCGNHTVMNELKNCTKNFEKSIGLSFDSNIPVLFFLASQSCKHIKVWEKLHRDIIQNHRQSKIVILEGSHFLHYEYPTEIAKIFKEWMQTL